MGHDFFHTVNSLSPELLTLLVPAAGVILPAVKELWQNSTTFGRMRGATSRVTVDLRNAPKSAADRKAYELEQKAAQKAAESAQEGAEGAGEGAAPKKKSRLPWKRTRKPKDTTVKDLKRHFRREVSRLKATTGSKEYLYEYPWYLMIGPNGSGKTTLLEQSGLVPWSSTSSEPSPGEKYVSWWSSEGAVVLDVTGDFVLREGNLGNERGWRTLVSLLQKYRYRRPIDGVVIAISCSDLIGPDRLDPDELARRGALLHARLVDIEKKLGMCVPVYPVFTGADQVPGFASFCSQLPEARRNEIFGWSNPFTLETAYTSEWVESAFRSIWNTLTPAQLEMFAGLPMGADGDSLFLFPSEFQTMADGVQAYTDQIFKPGTYLQTTLIMRGIYFTGDGTLPTVATPVNELEQIVAPTPIPDIPLPFALEPPKPAAVIEEVVEEDHDRSLYFVRELFNEKILAEYAIGYPFSGSLLSRNKLVRFLQAMIVVVLLGSTFGFYFEYQRLSKSKEVVLEMLQKVESDLSKVEGRDDIPEETYVEYAVQVLNGFSIVEDNRLWSLFYPSSWFSPLHSNIQESMAKAFDKVILRAMKTQLELRARDIREGVNVSVPLDSLTVNDATIEKSPEFVAARRFTDELAELERHYKMYNHLPQSQKLEEVQELVKYLFHRDLPPTFLDNSSYYQKALQYVTLVPFTPDPHRPPSTKVAEQLLSRLYDRMFSYNVVLMWARRIVADVDYLAASSGGDGFESVRRMRQLYQTIRFAKAALASPSLAWMTRESFQPTAALKNMLEMMKKSPFLDPTLPGRFLDSCNNRFAYLKVDIQQEQSDVIGQIIGISEGATTRIHLQPPVDSLGVAIGDLLGQKFMRANKAEEITSKRTPGVRVLWGVDQLEEALKLPEFYDAFAADGLMKFPQKLQLAATNTARSGLETSMSILVNQAQRPEISFRSEDDIAREVQGFKTAAPQFNKLNSVFSNFGLRAGSQLRSALTRQSSLILADVRGVLDGYGSYTIEPGKLSEWNGDNPPLGPALGEVLIGAADDAGVTEYLDGQRTKIQKLANEFAEPLVSFLSSVGATSQEVNEWKAIISELKKYDAKSPGNSVTQLESLFHDLNSITLLNYGEKLPSRGRRDYFMVRREKLRDDIYNYIRSLIFRRAVISYRRLQKNFTDTLESRAPFTTMKDRSVYDAASLEDVRYHFKLYDAFMETYREIWRGWNRPTVPNEFRIYTWLMEMQQVRELLAPLLINDPDKVAALDVDVEFRVNQTKDEGRTNIIDWRLQIGDQVASIEDFARQATPLPLQWQVGDKITLTLRWAKDAAYIPQEVLLGDGVVLSDGRTVVYTFNSPWSLFHMMSVHRTDPKEIDRLNTGRKQILNFTIRTTPNPEGNFDPAFYNSAIDQTARVYIRVGILGRNKRDRMTVRDFPREAPELR